MSFHEDSFHQTVRISTKNKSKSLISLLRKMSEDLQAIQDMDDQDEIFDRAEDMRLDFEKMIDTLAPFIYWKTAGLRKEVFG